MSASAEQSKGRDTLVKMLLTNSSVPFQKNLELGAIADRDLDQNEDILHETFVSYIQALTRSSQRRIPLVWMEHSYARSRGTSGEGGAPSASGARLLLVRKAPQCPDCHSEEEQDDQPIDVDTVENEPTPPLLLDELPQWERALEDGEILSEEDESKPDWERKLHGLPWNKSQETLLNGAMDALLSARAALLTAGKAGAKRAAARGGAARALRALLAAPPIRWQSRLVQWLHNALTEHLPPPLLACYKEIILTLKSKVPVLVEKMTIGHPVTGRVRGFENGASGPTIASGSGAPPDPGAPILLLLPSGRDRRDARWAERLRAVAQVHQVHSHQSSWIPQLPVSACLAQLVGSGRARAAALRAEHPYRPLILVGQGAGAAIAVQLAVNVTGVSGVVCLGLPLLTAAGPRGDPEDCLLDLPCPVLFVIGQNATQCTQQDVESLRLKLRVRSRLVVAGGADDLLRLPRLKRQLEGVTQRMLECAIADEVGSFLSCLSQWDDSADGDMAAGGSSPSGSCEGETETEGSMSLSIPIAITSPQPHSLLPPAPTLAPPLLVTAQAQKRKGTELPSPKPKKPRVARAIKNSSPLKIRGMALYQVNNPPPEGASISMGQLLSTPKGHDDGYEIEEIDTTCITPLMTKSEPGSYIQISNNRLTRSIPLTGGNGTNRDISSGSTIKVLENIPYKMSRVTAPKVMGTISGLATTPLVLPRKSQNISPHMTQNNQMSTSITPADIMDIPIIFADDDKAIVSQQSKVTTNLTHQGSPSAIKSIIINKQSLSNTSPDMKQRITSISNQLSSKNLVQLKMPNNVVNSSFNQTILNSGPTTQTINLKKGSITTNNTLKYTKVILAKKTPDSNNTSLNISNVSESTETTERKVIGKPIIVKGKGGPMTAFKFLPSPVFQTMPNVLSQPRQLIIKKSPGAAGMNVNIVKANKNDASLDSTSDRAIEAAVASITGDPEYGESL